MYISGDRKSLTVRFFWLRQLENNTGVDLLTKVEDFYPSDCAGENKLLVSSESGSRVMSGTILRISTDDPVKRPLPNWDLLDMQWVLQRATALSGGLEDYETFMGEKDISNPETYSWLNVRPRDNQSEEHDDASSNSGYED